MAERFGWALEYENLIKPLYKYYRLSRNCIAHRNSVISPALAAASTDAGLQMAKASWCRVMHEISEPPVKTLTVGGKLDFTHQDAIFSSSLSRLIALQLNGFALNVMGFNGLVYFKTKRNILTENLNFPIKLRSELTPVIAEHLRQNNNLKDVSATVVKIALDELGLLQQSNDAFYETKVKRFPKVSADRMNVRKRKERKK